MNIATTLLFYLLIGAAVAVAIGLSKSAASGRERWFHIATAVAFWPLYLPVLLQSPPSVDEEESALGPPHRAKTIASAKTNAIDPSDPVAVSIQQVEAELDLALSSLTGWADAALAREQPRFAELRAAWHAQGEKIRELDRLLSQPAFAATDASATAVADDRIASSLRARQANIARLRALREQLHNDLMNTLVWVRELVTMIHLAKYSGAPASRAEELVLQIATSVEGLSEVATWHDADCPAAV
jgi:hypothetical protein